MYPYLREFLCPELLEKKVKTQTDGAHSKFHLVRPPQRRAGVPWASSGFLEQLPLLRGIFDVCLQLVSIILTLQPTSSRDLVSTSSQGKEKGIQEGHDSSPLLYKQADLCTVCLHSLGLQEQDFVLLSKDSSSTKFWFCSQPDSLGSLTRNYCLLEILVSSTKQTKE